MEIEPGNIFPSCGEGLKEKIVIKNKSDNAMGKIMLTFGKNV